MKAKLSDALPMVTTVNQRCSCSRYVLALGSFSTGFAPLGFTFVLGFFSFALTYGNSFPFQL